MKRLVRITTFLATLMGCSCALAQGVTPFADVLLLHASEDTTSIWSSVVAGSPGPGAPSTFTPAQIQFNWNAGLRAGFTFKPPEWLWDMKLYWTYFQTSSSSSVSPGGQLVIPEFFSGFLSGDQYSFIAGAVNWKLFFNTIDLETGHEFSVGEFVTLRPFFGLKAAFISQKIHAQWSDPLFGLNAVENVSQNFQGIGPSFGVGGRWNIPRCPSLSLVGSVSGALMYGTWNVTDNYQRPDPTVTPGTFRSMTTSLNESSLGTLMLRYFFGLQWTREGEYPITAHLGYEMQWWANQQRLTTFQQLPMHGDLTLQGGSCGISVCY